MHNVHFIKVNAKNCDEAISKAHGCISIENSLVDYFQIIGAFDIKNPNKFIASNEVFNDYLGLEPEQFINDVLKCLNRNVKPLKSSKQELIKLIKQVNNKTLKSCLPWQIFSKAKELAGNYLITDLLKQSKYENEWEEIGLTDFCECEEDITHIVLVDFHS